MSISIWPSANDINPVTGEGMIFRETHFTELLKTLIGQNFIVSGFTMPASDGDLSISVASGIAVIDGRYVYSSGAINVTVTPSQTNYIWLTLSKDVGLNADGAYIQATLSSSNPGSSVGLGIAVAGGSSVSSITDTRFLSGVMDHSHLSIGGKGGLLGTNSVGTSQVKLTAQSFTTGSITDNVGGTATFTVTGARIGDFTINPSSALGGTVVLEQIHVANNTDPTTTWRITIGSDGTGAGTTTYAITWNILATVT